MRLFVGRFGHADLEFISSPWESLSLRAALLELVVEVDADEMEE